MTVLRRERDFHAAATCRSSEESFTLVTPRSTLDSSDMIKLGVNIDHVATSRQARISWRGAGAPNAEPDPIAAALAAERAGAHGITAHLRLTETTF